MVIFLESTVRKCKIFRMKSCDWSISKPFVSGELLMGIRSPCVLLSGISSFICADFGFVKHPLHAITLRRLVFKLFSCFSQENIATRSNIKKKYVHLSGIKPRTFQSFSPVIGLKKNQKIHQIQVVFFCCCVLILPSSTWEVDPFVWSIAM